MITNSFQCKLPFHIRLIPIAGTEKVIYQPNGITITVCDAFAMVNNEKSIYSNILFSEIETRNHIYSLINDYQVPEITIEEIFNCFSLFFIQNNKRTYTFAELEVLFENDLYERSNH